MRADRASRGDSGAPKKRGPYSRLRNTSNDDDAVHPWFFSSLRDAATSRSLSFRSRPVVANSRARFAIHACEATSAARVPSPLRATDGPAGLRFLGPMTDRSSRAAKLAAHSMRPKVPFPRTRGPGRLCARPGSSRGRPGRRGIAEPTQGRKTGQAHRTGFASGAAARGRRDGAGRQGNPAIDRLRRRPSI